MRRGWFGLSWEFKRSREIVNQFGFCSLDFGFDGRKPGQKPRPDPRHDKSRRARSRRGSPADFGDGNGVLLHG